MCVCFNATNAENISCTGTKSNYCYHIVHSPKYSRSFIKDDQQLYKTCWRDALFKQCTVILMMFRGMISEGELWLARRSTAHQGPLTISLPPLVKAIACLFMHFPCRIQINMAVLGLPGGSGARHVLSSVSFPVLIAPQESQRGLYVRFYLQRRTGGKLNEA